MDCKSSSNPIFHDALSRFNNGLDGSNHSATRNFSLNGSNYCRASFSKTKNAKWIKNEKRQNEEGEEVNSMRPSHYIGGYSPDWIHTSLRGGLDGRSLHGDDSLSSGSSHDPRASAKAPIKIEGYNA